MKGRKWKMRNKKLFIPNLIQFLYLDRCIGLRLILLRNVILQRYYYDITIRSFRFVNVHLIASNKGESANQKAAYKIIVLIDLSVSIQFPIPHSRGSSHGQSRITRKAYGEMEHYTVMMKEAYPLWETLERESGTKIFRYTTPVQLLIQVNVKHVS